MPNVRTISLCLTTLCLLIWSCQSSKEVVVEPLVKPPIPELNPEFQSFEFDAGQGLNFALENGSEIVIPPNALVGSNGEPVSGQVTADYRELHDALSIYLSGVPMEYQTPDTAWQFTTAGTFELRARQGNNSLSLAPGQKASVKMASFVGGEDYQFFYLDENGGRWDSLGSSKPQVNLAKEKQMKKIKQMMPANRFPLNRQYLAFNYEIIADIFYNDKRVGEEMHEQLKSKLKQYGLGWSNVHSYEFIEFKGKKEAVATMVWKNIARTAFPDWTKNRSGKLKKIKGNTYELAMYNKDSSQVFQCKLRAVMTLKSLLAFSPEYWAGNYKEAMAKIAEEENRVKEMAEVFRHFEVSNFGIYNWDRMMKEEEAIPLLAQFSLGTGLNERLTEPEIVYISNDNKSVIRYLQRDWERFSLWPQKGGRLFCLLPGKKLSLFTKEQYQKIDFESLRKITDPTYLFKMEENVHSFTSQKELKEILEI